MTLQDIRWNGRAGTSGGPAQPLGQHLLDSGAISSAQLMAALDRQRRESAPLGEILVARGEVDPDQVQAALARQRGLMLADFATIPPEPALSRPLPWRDWLRLRVLPWRRMGGATLVATSHPERFERMRPDLEAALGPVVPVLASDARIMDRIAARWGPDLARAATQRAPAAMSCRSWGMGGHRLTQGALPLALLALLAAPQTTLALLTLLAVLALTLFAALRLTAFTAQLLGQPHLTAPPPARDALPAELPHVSVMVPLFREREIAGHLVERLKRLSYPRARLDVMLVLEARDDLTREVLAETELPPWMRVIEVPPSGGITTKPRAMNYALDFCRGEIIGVWDAEDAPVPDQIETVVARFASAPPDVVCLQGILDYYNPRANWLARCFTIEYAAWFRVLLPGIARLGLVVPLGGTTLFFRRHKLEELGGWDAHNVTEDADLGVRLCRAGYRTELIDTVTFEEANCRPVAWVKQRSRWLKGFMVTYLVHMRRPARLWRELGPARFLGLQAFFLGTCGQFLLAPMLWSLWALSLGAGHPVLDLVPRGAALAATGLFVGLALLDMAIHATAVSAPQRRFLLPWIVTMPLYFPLGTLAAYKALWELVRRPFYWDKTAHGLSGADPGAPQPGAPRPRPSPRRR